jgi:hypothetical protein
MATAVRDGLSTLVIRTGAGRDAASPVIRDGDLQPPPAAQGGQAGGDQ